jgi:hypothetical protein
MKFLLTVLAGLLVFSSASAHGLATAKQQIVNDMLLEFEYDRPGNVPAGEFMVYNVDIIDTKTNQAIVFDRAYVRISKASGQNVLITDIYPTTLFGGIVGGRLGGVIEEPGDYKVDLGFYKDGKELGSAQFDHTIGPRVNPIQSSENGKTDYLWLASLLIGFIAGLLLAKFTSAKTQRN